MVSENNASSSFTSSEQEKRQSTTETDESTDDRSQRGTGSAVGRRTALKLIGAGAIPVSAAAGSVAATGDDSGYGAGGYGEGGYGTDDEPSSPAPGQLAVTIIDANGPVAAGERFELTAEVANTGGETISQAVELHVGEGQTGVDSETVTVTPGESRTITLGYDTYPVRQDVTFPVYVVSRDDEAERVIEVYAASPGHLDVTITETNEPVHGGERFEVTAQLENTGDRQVTQDVQFLVGEGRDLTDSESVTVEPGETQTITLGYDTYPVQQDVTFPVFVVSEEDEAERVIEVYAASPGHLDVTITETNEPVHGGERFDVTVQVENTGGEPTTQEVAFFVGEGQERVDAQTATVSPSESRTITLGYDTYPVRQDVTFPVSVASEDDDAERVIEVFAADS